MARMPIDGVISHWSKLVENLRASPLDFYASVEAAIQRRQIPDVSIDRIDYKEGGLISARREYLRVKRGKNAFDICAAPFGTGFFFSSWLAEVPFLTGLQKLLIIAGLFIVLVLFASQSLVSGTLLFIFIFFASLLAISSGDYKFDEAILELPGIGRLYARFFKAITYYRIDTALMFQSAVQAAVLESIDALTNAQGIRPISDLERKPIFTEFVKG